LHVCPFFMEATMTKEHKNICLFDSWNSYGNIGQKNALWTPHFEPDQEWIDNYNDGHEVPWDPARQDNPDYERDAESFWEDIQLFDKEAVATYNWAEKGKIDGLLITGTLGLWDGRHNIYPVFCHTLEGALRKCWGQCDDFRVDIQNGVITAYAYHHDGRNVFTIRGVSTSSMAPAQTEALYESGNGLSLYAETYENLFGKTNRHIRKINLLKTLGFVERRLHGMRTMKLKQTFENGNSDGRLYETV